MCFSEHELLLTINRKKTGDNEKFNSNLRSWRQVISNFLADQIQDNVNYVRALIIFYPLVN